MSEMVPLAAVVVEGRLECSLEEGALHLARQEYPELQIEPCLATLDGFAESVRALLSSDAPPPEIIGALNDVFFRDLGFRGNQDDYYTPQNSFLNIVIETRQGIPISLATLYSGVARRLGLELEGTAFPAHFLLRCNRPGWPILIDCYHGGHILDEEDCRTRLAALGAETWDPRVIEPVSSTAVLRRMLNNLKVIYWKQNDWERLRRTTLQILVVTPEDHGELFTLGIASVGLEQRDEATEHLQRFLALCPDAPNRRAAEDLLAELRGSGPMLE